MADEILEEVEVPAQIYVTNRNDFLHEDRYAGDDYVFPPGEPVLVSGMAAVHMFGYGLKDKTGVLVRLGWASKYDEQLKRMVQDDAGVQKLANFVFEEAVVRPRSALERALDQGQPEIA